MHVKIGYFGRQKITWVQIQKKCCCWKGSKHTNYTHKVFFFFLFSTFSKLFISPKTMSWEVYRSQLVCLSVYRSVCSFSVCLSISSIELSLLDLSSYWTNLVQTSQIDQYRAKICIFSLSHDVFFPLKINVIILVIFNMSWPNSIRTSLKICLFVKTVKPEVS